MFHPFLLAVAPVLFLYAFNIDQVVFGDALWPLLVSLAVASALFFALSALLKNKKEAGLLVSLGLILFFSYGHLMSVLRELGLTDGPWLWLPVFAAAFAAGAFLVVRYRDRLTTPTYLLNVVAIVLVGLSLFNIVSHELRSKPEVPQPDIVVKEGKKPAGVTEPPDIYYIILDAYGSQSTLEEAYGFDNSEFLGFLQEKGFYVPEDSRSNYFETFLSLSSALNMEYLGFLEKDPGPDSNDRSIPYQMLQDNAVARFLKSSGYEYVFFASGWSGTSHSRAADRVVAEHHLFDNEFWNALVRTTALRPLARNWLFTRAAVNATFERIPEAVGRSDGPAFVFAHIVPPHHPFRFAADGGLPEPAGSGVEARKAAYVEQVQYVNGKIEELVDDLLSREGPRPVIIIQGDHGPSYAGNPASREASPGKREPVDEYVQERSGILNAYYLPAPDGGTVSLYEGISPVNSFREVFDLYLGTGMERLPDRIYYSTYSRPFDFRDVTDTVKDAD